MNIKSKKGMMLETIINKTINFYYKNNIAIIQKKELQIKFKKIEKGEGKINVKNAFINKKSSVDYYGIYKGKFLAFEAKSCKSKIWNIKNLKNHQMEYLNKIKKHNGMAFIILGFITYNKFFILDIKEIENLKKSSINLDYSIKNFKQIELIFPGILNFLKLIKK